MRKGAAMLMAIILMGISSMSLFFVLDSVVFQSYLIRNRQDNIQEYFSSKENFIYNVFYKEIYIPKILDTIPTAVKPYVHTRINTFDLEGRDGLITTGVIDLSYKYDDISYDCKLTTEGKSGETVLSGKLLNDFFPEQISKNKIPHLNYNNVDIAKLPEFMEFFDSIPSKLDLDDYQFDTDYQIIHIGDGENIKIRGGNYNSSLSMIREDGSSSKIKTTTNIFIESPDDLRTDLILEINNRDYSRLSGVIYIENGDLILKGNCYINALIIMGNGEIIVDGAFTPTITGMVITNDSIDYSSKLAMEYSGEIIVKHGFLVPGLMDPSIDSIEYIKWQSHLYMHNFNLLVAYNTDIMDVLKR